MDEKKKLMEKFPYGYDDHGTSGRKSNLYPHLFDDGERFVDDTNVQQCSTTVLSRTYEDRYENDRLISRNTSPVDSIVQLPPPQSSSCFNSNVSDQQSTTCSIVSYGTGSTQAVVHYHPSNSSELSSTSNNHVQKHQCNNYEREKNNNSTEYTPLLEDFTEKFIESQLASSVPSEQVNISTQLVPPELLLICQQQAPFNPNVLWSQSDSDSDDEMSTSVLDSVDGRMWRAHTVRTTKSRKKESFVRKSIRYLSQLCWLGALFILFIALFSHSFGMLFTPQVYQLFLTTGSAKNCTKSLTPTHPVVIDEDYLHQTDASITPTTTTFTTTTSSANLFTMIVTVSLLQFVVWSLATVGGLLLLYTAHVTLAKLRKRYYSSSRYRNIMGRSGADSNVGVDIVQSNWSLFTIERVAAQTMGTFMSRIVSLIVIAYLFGYSVLNILLMFDYIDLLFVSVPVRVVNLFQLFCDQKWFVNHLVIFTLLIVLVLAVVGFCWCGCRFRTTSHPQVVHLYTLATFKWLVGLIGTVAVVYVTGVMAYQFISSYESDSKLSDDYRAPKIFSLFGDKDIPNDHDDHNESFWIFNWKFIHQKSWLMLVTLFPLLVMPFHLNEMLVMILYSIYDGSYYRKNFSNKTFRPNQERKKVSNKFVTKCSNSSENWLNNNNNVVDDDGGGGGEVNCFEKNPRQPPPEPIYRSLSSHKRNRNVSSHPVSQPQTLANPNYSFKPQVATGTSSQSEQINRQCFQYGAIDRQPDNRSNQASCWMPNAHLFYLLSIRPDRSTGNIYSHFFHKSFFPIRNWFLLVSVGVLLLNIVITVFYRQQQLFNSATVNSNEPKRLMLDLNIIRHIFPRPHYRDSPTYTLWKQEYLISGVAGVLLVKTVVTYLLTLFRISIAIQSLFNSANFAQTTVNEANPRTKTNILAYLLQFVFWNSLAVIVALCVEQRPFSAALSSIVWTVASIAVVLAILVPALMYLCVTIQSLQHIKHSNRSRNNRRATGHWSKTQTSSNSLAPVSWFKCRVLLSGSLLMLTVLYGIFWLYSYINIDQFDQSPHRLSYFWSLIPQIRHTNSSALYCQNIHH